MMGRETNEIYEIISARPQDKFKYVGIKIRSMKQTESTIKDEAHFSTLIQIIDFSIKIFLKEVKDREIYQQMVNATVSHELRNPLNSLGDQK